MTLMKSVLALLPTDDCVRWPGHLSPAGYGVCGFRTYGTTHAHRYTFTVVAGPIPEGLHLDHLCRNRACVNPAHLEPVTPGENARRAVEATFGVDLDVTCRYGHPRSETRIYPGGQFRCAVCYDMRERELKPCGTHAGYARHRYRGEVPCPECRAGHNAYTRQLASSGGA